MFDFVKLLLVDIPEDKLTVSVDVLVYTIITEVFSDYTVADNERTIDYPDDVRYCAMIEDDKYSPVCVQDFDLKDYDLKLFLSSEDSIDDLWGCYRTDLSRVLDIDISEADMLAKSMTELVCKHLKQVNYFQTKKRVKHYGVCFYEITILFGMHLMGKCE